MYLPKSKYIVKFTKGGEFTKSDGSRYVGSYIETYKGNVYEGKTFNSKSKKLIDLRGGPDEHTLTAKFKSDRIVPTEEDYKKGTFKRYIVQDKRTNKIVEVSYKNYIKLSNELYTESVVISWELSKPLENLNKGPYIYFGAKAKNKEAVLEAEKTIQGLSSFLNNYGQFVV